MDDEPSSLLAPIAFCSAIFFVFGTFVLTAISTALRQIYRREPKKSLKALEHFLLYRKFHLYFFPNREFEGLFFATTCAQNITRFCYVASFFLFLASINLFPSSLPTNSSYSWGLSIFSIITFFLFAFFIGDFWPRILGRRYPGGTLRFFGPIASLFMLLIFPLTYIILKISSRSKNIVYFDDLPESIAQAKEELIAIIQAAEVSSRLDPHEKKLVESVVTFQDRIAREVMVPRVDVFSLSADISIRDAAKLLQSEGYSRIPVYRNNVDNIIGVLMYKDILNKYMEYDRKGQDLAILDAPVETIIKNVLYTPETKKISNLLQEFRKRQVHLAIVVDEYGGTEGIVTIEDILEEIVGEIADEYDEKEALYTPQPDGGWIVDARLNILDAEELLDIKIPQEGDYDTIGGYIFHRTGTIPPKGVIIHHDTFDLEILDSSDRSVEQVRIRPVSNSDTPRKEEKN